METNRSPNTSGDLGGSTDRDSHTRDLKAALAGLREKLQKNLAILQTHLDAVGAIAAIISRAIQEHESDGTYTPELGRNGRSHEAANCHRHLDNRCYDGGGICEFHLGIPEHRKRSAYKKGGGILNVRRRCHLMFR
jgi:hypothetical protein